MEDLIASEFFGFVPDKLYHEVYAIGYNEFLTAVSTLRETLHKEFPNDKEEVDRCCGSFLASYSRHFDQEWFAKFLQYCSKNIFTVPRSVPVYQQRLGAEENNGAMVKLEEYRHRVMAVEYLNAQLLAWVKRLDEEIASTKAVLEEIKHTEEKLQLVEKMRGLDEQLSAVESKAFTEQ